MTTELRKISVGDFIFRVLSGGYWDCGRFSTECHFR